MAPPAPQRMPQQPDKVVALGKPVLQHMREPAMRYPNNVLYPGQPVGMRRVVGLGNHDSDFIYVTPRLRVVA